MTTDIRCTKDECLHNGSRACMFVETGEQMVFKSLDDFDAVSCVQYKSCSEAESEQRLKALMDR